MDIQVTYADLQTALDVIQKARYAVATGSPAWVKLYHASCALEGQQAALLADPCANCKGCVDCVPAMSNPNDLIDQRSH